MAQAGKIARGAMSRDPKRETDVKGGEGGDAAKAAARLARRTPVERLSPGVYRSASGDLVTQAGRPIRRPQSSPWANQIAQMQQGTAQQIGGGAQGAGGMQGGMAGQVAGQYNAMNPWGDVMRGAGGTPGAALTAATSGADMGGMGNPKWPQMEGIRDAMLRVPPGEGGQLNQGPMQNLIASYPGMPQMPQASANMGGQYRLSPGVYGTREQAMNQYNQQLQDMMAQYRMPNVPQQRRG